MPTFGAASLAALSKCHPKLKIIALAAIKEIDFRILDATRGRDAQERAFATGKSKARFGQSAHNYVPAIAFDLFPAPYDWNNRQSFINLSKVVLRIGKEQGIPLRWGGDWDMKGDGNPRGSLEDLPHYELQPWREWAHESRLFED